MADNDPKTPEGEADKSAEPKPAKTDKPEGDETSKSGAKAVDKPADKPKSAAKSEDTSKTGAKSVDKPADKPKGGDKPRSEPKAKPIDMGTSLKDVVKGAAASKTGLKAAAPKAQAATEAPKTVRVGGESFVDRVLPHMKKIIISILVIVVVLSGFFGYRSYQDSKREAATEKLVAVITVGERPVRPPGMPVNAKDDSFPDDKARAAAVLDAIAKQEGDPGHAYHGTMLVAAGRLDEAMTEFKLGQDAPSIDGVLCREGLGLALEAKASAEKDAAARQKGYEDALAAFKNMQPDESGPRRAYALYHQGRMLQLLGKTAEAKTAYQKAKELAKGTDLEPDERELMVNPRLPRLIDSRLDALGAS